MCGNASVAQSHAAYFNCTRLNRSTFMIIESDKYGESPQIFAKVCSSTVVLLDTGCGGNPNNGKDTLMNFLEMCPVADNDGVPINQHKKPYTVISTHCHYDHIGGMAEFAANSSSTIWASSNNKRFLSPGSLPKNSLCDNVGMETPKYTITNWCQDAQIITDPKGRELNLIIYTTPGHTPDHVAIWDPDERHLFVGDTLYRRAPVFFLFGGSAIDYSKTIGKLRRLVDEWNREAASESCPANTHSRVNLSCGHITNNTDACDILADMDNLLYRVVTGQLKAVDGGENYGIKSITYTAKDLDLGLSGFNSAFSELLENNDATEAVRQRNGAQ